MNQLSEKRNGQIAPLKNLLIRIKILFKYLCLSTSSTIAIDPIYLIVVLDLLFQLTIEGHDIRCLVIF